MSDIPRRGDQVAVVGARPAEREQDKVVLGVGLEDVVANPGVVNVELGEAAVALFLGDVV